jgi:hypothetical protein
MDDFKPIEYTTDVEIIPLESQSSAMSLEKQNELRGEIRIGTAIKRLIVMDENNIPVMVMGYQKNGF